MPVLEDGAGMAILVALIAYGLSGGADFGGGVWDLLASGPRAARQRQLIAHSMGPIWEANHIWLILAIVVLFTAFPPAFARIATVLHLPLLLMLLGIVARGAAFSFRSYGGPGGPAGPAGPGGPAGERAGPWGTVFAVASLITPLWLGIVVGAIARGSVRPPRSAADFLTAWIGPFPFAVGAFALALFAFLAAVYLAHDARRSGDDGQPGAAAGQAAAAGGGPSPLSEDFRRRALVSGLLLAPLAAGVLAVAGREAPRLLHGLTRTPWSWALHALTAACAVTALAALARRRLGLARAAAAAQAALILAGWALAQYPYLVPPDLTLAAAAAPAVVLRDLLVALAAGALLLLPAFFYLYRVFGHVRGWPSWRGWR
jgi:cytochrome d ubiquinol oxidase subunit II